MSIAAVSWVFEHSESTLAGRLLLLVLADLADEEGRIMRKFLHGPTLLRLTRLSQMQFNHAMARLESLGELEHTADLTILTGVAKARKEGPQ